MADRRQPRARWKQERHRGLAVQKSKDQTGRPPTIVKFENHVRPLYNLISIFARRRFQLVYKSPSAPLDHFCRGTAPAGPGSGGHLHQPGRLFQPLSVSSRGGDRARSSSPATASAAGYWSAGPCPVVAQCARIDLRHRGHFRRSSALDPARVSERRIRGRDLLRDQRHRRAPRITQAALEGRTKMAAPFGACPEQNCRAIFQSKERWGSRLEFHGKRCLCHGGLTVHSIRFEPPPAQGIHGGTSQDIGAVQRMHAHD